MDVLWKLFEKRLVSSWKEEKFMQHFGTRESLLSLQNGTVVWQFFEKQWNGMLSFLLHKLSLGFRKKVISSKIYKPKTVKNKVIRPEGMELEIRWFFSRWRRRNDKECKLIPVFIPRK